MAPEKPKIGTPRSAELAALNRRFRPALIAFFLRRLRDHAQAEDLTQELFTRLAAKSGEEIERPEAYLFQMANNLLRDYGRRDKVRANYREAMLANEEYQVEFRNAERVVLARESINQILTVLGSLPERTRSIFILYRLEAMSRKHIAEAYGISVSAVEKHLSTVMAAILRSGGQA